MALNEVFLNPIYPVLPVGIVLAVVFLVFIFLLLIKKAGIKELISSGVRLFLVLALVFIINLRPMLLGDKADLETRNLDILFVVDTTISMWAEDYDGNHKRMEAVIEDCEHIMDELSGANFGLIRFDNNAQILAPFTQDSRNVKDAFDTIKAPDEYYARGSDLSVPIVKMQELLKSSEAKEDRKTIVYFISDGEITNEADLVSYEALAGLIDYGAVLGYGTGKGGRMRYSDYGGYIYDPETENDAVSVIDENNLKKIASDLDVEYIHPLKKEDINPNIAYIKMLARSTVSKGKIETLDDRYYLFCLPLLVLLLISLVKMAYLRKL